jgi:hypothetical protein
MRVGRLGAVVLLVAIVMVVGILRTVVRVVTPDPPRPTAAREVFGPSLTKRLALIVLDGIRYDVATDGRRMPRLAQRFHGHAGAELWAEPISMTASAALVIGTGTHAGIDLAIRNETAKPSPYEDVFTTARGAGLRTGIVGDPVWTNMYPGAWDVMRADPHLVAVGADDDAAALLAAKATQTLTPPLDLGVYHFNTPDHMAHGHGIASAAYEAYIAGFDAHLDELLAAFPPDTTVIVLGDHGATMAGIHGSGTDEQRRTFLVAWGPGIVPGARTLERVDDVDLAPTLAALLGVPPPRSSRGHPLTAWLAMDDASRAALACANVRALAEVAGEGDLARGACEPGQSTGTRLAAARASARDLDARIGERLAAAQGGGMRVSAFSLAMTALLAWLVFAARGEREAEMTRRARGLTALAFGVALAASVLVTARLETLPGAWLTPARIALYLVFNAPLVVWLVRPAWTSTLLAQRPVLAPLVLPGLLVLTETHSALVESYALSVVLVGFALTRGVPGASASASASARPSSLRELAFFAPLVFGTAVVCIDAGNFVPPSLLGAPTVQLGFAVASLVAFAAVRHRRLRPTLGATASCAALAVACLVLRRAAPPSLCLAGWALCTTLALAAAFGRRRAMAELVGIAAYAWVSRDLEIPFLLATYLVAVAFGEALARDLARPASSNAPQLAVLALVTFAFAWGYVQTVAIQQGIHFMHLDFGAGTFRDPDVTLHRIVFALIYKYTLARAFLLFGLLAPLTHAIRLRALAALVAVYALRATVLVASLEAARHSFWTPIWVTSELPHVLLPLVLAAAAAAFARARAPISVPEASIHV